MGYTLTQTHYSTGDGIAAHPTLSFSTPQDVYKTMDITDKSRLNALKTFFNDRHVVVAWHNGTADDECRCNGFHTHLIAHCPNKIWHDQQWRTCRSKLAAAGANVRTQGINNLPGIINDLTSKPKVVVGSNNALLCSKLIKYKNSQSLSVTEFNQIFTDDETVPEASAEDGGQSGFMADMLGWQEKSGVSVPEKKLTDSMNIAEYIKSLTSTDTTDAADMTLHNICKNKPGQNPTATATASETKLPETKTVKKIGVLRELLDKYSKYTQQDLLRAIIRLGDCDDIKNYRILKTSPNFNTIWNQVIAEISAEKAEKGSTYLDSLMTYVNQTDQGLTRAETASLFLG